MCLVCKYDATRPTTHSFNQTCAMLRSKRRFIPGRKFDYLTLEIRVIAQRQSFGISVKRASRVLQFMTTMTKSYRPHLLLKQAARHGPAVGVTPVLMPAKVPMESCCQSKKFVFFHAYLWPFLMREGTT